MRITSYFGFEIHVHESSGIFSIQKGWYTEEEPFTAPTLEKLKKLIDKFVKKNTAWKPLPMQQFTYDSLIPDDDLVTVVGVDDEGCFVLRGLDEDGGEKTFTVAGSYEEANIIVPDPRNEPIVAEIKKLGEEIAALELKAHELSSALHRKTLRDLRTEMNIIDSAGEFRN